MTLNTLKNKKTTIQLKIKRTINVLLAFEDYFNFSKKNVKLKTKPQILVFFPKSGVYIKQKRLNKHLCQNNKMSSRI
ncbi:hypothetical protein JCM19300_3819 [Algibacter lectus]|uniref:Uncharacterized protein n=1 Tax=Algibacter lectus TaxID=221126 RepID=A0A090V7V0_9FLAO|nr:hypothetical protein DFQ06_1939 [Algibacter lectus]GAL60881.1 hypothetical protein JCM19300_3819 [Algibacter lectus]